MNASVIPCLRYHDAGAALDWLCAAFGFTRKLVVPGPAETIAHAELCYRNGMVMLGSAQLDNEYGKLVSTVQQLGGNSQSLYVVVEDADEHCRRAQAAGARVVLPVKDEGYGGRGYSCLDLEGNLWSFGTYDPWSPQS